MKFISWNVNGFRSCLGKGFADFFAAQNADFFCIQETKMKQGQAEFAPEGYYQYWNSAEKKGYSGTAIFTKHEPMNVSYGIGIPEHDTEGRAITLEYEGFYLLCVYTPNSQRELTRLSYRMTWEDALREYMIRLDAKKPVIYCGDLNVAHNDIDLKNPKTNHFSAGFTDEERGKFGELLSVGFTDTFRYLYPSRVTYSWWSYMYSARAKNIGWRIDYFVISDRLRKGLSDSMIFTDVMGSDHCPVGIELEMPTVSFRAAKDADVSAVAALYDSVKGGEGCVWDENYPCIEEAQADLELGNLYVLEKGGEVIGAISVENSVAEVDALGCFTVTENTREFARVAISPDQRGHGYAAVMVRELVDVFKKDGCKAVHILAASINIAAQKTYERIGFVRRGECDMYGSHYFAYELTL